MENQFIRHEPCFERILFVLTLDREENERADFDWGRTADPLPAERGAKTQRCFVI